MTRHEILAKISHYDWMLETMTLRPAHQFWIKDQLEDLHAALVKLREVKS